MRTFLAATAGLLALWGCRSPDAGLPPAYRALAVPERVVERAPDAARRGRELYLASCALCHGEDADGRGVRRSSLSTRPVDFTQRSWCRATTPRQVYHAVREGVDGTAMPAWKALDEDQCWDLVAYLLTVCEGDVATRQEMSRPEKAAPDGWPP